MTAPQTDNAVLQEKLKVLVEKIEEYRSTEDAMRLALLSAQKMSVDIENEAKEKAKQLTSEAEKTGSRLVADAKEEAARILSDAKSAVAGEEAKVAAAKQVTANFVERIREVCSQQLSFIENLDDLRLPTAEKQDSGADILDTVRSIEDSVAKMVDAPAEEQPEIDISPAMAAAEAPVVNEPTRLYAAAPAADEGPIQFDFESLSFDD